MERDQAGIVEDRSADVPRAKLSESVVLEIIPGTSASRQRSVGTASAFTATNPELPTLVSECDFFVQFWRTRKGPNQFADAMRDAE